ncbi:3286_t:CDS:1 [Diversispora eburnea]|uniref:3286_t:CDS:1 n=1 Tax=Diversispora eburnea TaxID=1213867 RepID=A0A9N9A3R4_9GLOM|nr:3286_t:CDS:1 [Diversispora eburnea]
MSSTSLTSSISEQTFEATLTKPKLFLYLTKFIKLPNVEEVFLTINERGIMLQCGRVRVNRMCAFISYKNFDTYYLTNLTELHVTILRKQLEKILSSYSEADNIRDIDNDIMPDTIDIRRENALGVITWKFNFLSDNLTVIINRDNDFRCNFPLEIISANPLEVFTPQEHNLLLKIDIRGHKFKSWFGNVLNCKNKFRFQSSSQGLLATLSRPRRPSGRYGFEIGISEDSVVANYSHDRQVFDFWYYEGHITHGFYNSVIDDGCVSIEIYDDGILRFLNRKIKDMFDFRAGFMLELIIYPAASDE